MFTLSCQATAYPHIYKMQDECMQNQGGLAGAVVMIFLAYKCLAVYITS